MYVCLCTQAQASTFGKEAKLQQPLKRNHHQKELTVRHVEPSLLPPGRREVVWEKEYKGVRWFKSSNPGSVPSSLGDLGWALHPSEHCGHLSNTGSRLSLHSAAGRVKYNNKHLACSSANWVSVSPFRVCWEKRRFFLANRNNCPTFLSIDCFFAPHEHPHLHYACIWPGSTSPVYTSLQLDILSTATKLHPLPSPSYVLWFQEAARLQEWATEVQTSAFPVPRWWLETSNSTSLWLRFLTYKMGMILFTSLGKKLGNPCKVWGASGSDG